MVSCEKLQKKKNLIQISSSVSSFLTAVPIKMTAVTVFLRSSFDETLRAVFISFA